MGIVSLVCTTEVQAGHVRSGVRFSIIDGNATDSTANVGTGTLDTLKESRVTGEKRSGRLDLNSPVKRMSSGEIRRRGFAEASEALRHFGGIAVRDYGGVGGLKTVSVRGFGAQHTNVIIDGIPLSDLQSGTADLGLNNFVRHYNITVSLIDNENIFKSAGQMVAAGSIEMNSEYKRLENQPFSIGGQLRYGSFNTLGAQLFYEQKAGRKVRFGAGLDYLHSDGDYPYESPGTPGLTRRRTGGGVSRLRPELDLNVALGDGALKAKVLADFAERGLPGPALLHTQNPTEHLGEKHCAAALSFTQCFNHIWRLKGSLSYDWKHSHWSDTSSIYPDPVHEHYRQHQALLSATILYSGQKGFSYAFAEDLGLGHLKTTLPDCPLPTRISSLSAASASYNGRIFSASATLALSYIKDIVRSGDPVPDKWHICPSASAGVRLPYGFKISASLRDGYRAPSFNDLYWTRMGTRSLRPEKAFQSNLGVNWAMQKEQISLSASIDGYCNVVRDKIVASPTLFIWSMHNIGRALMAGCDISANGIWRPLPSRPDFALDFDAGYSYMYAVDVSDPEAANYRDQIRYVPRHSGHGDFSIITPWFSLTYKLLFAGERYFQDQNTSRSRLAPYYDHGLSLNHDFTIKQSFMIGVSLDALNLGGKNYEIIRSYPMPGREFRATIRFQF